MKNEKNKIEPNLLSLILTLLSFLVLLVKRLLISISIVKFAEFDTPMSPTLISIINSIISAYYQN